MINAASQATNQPPLTRPFQQSEHNNHVCLAEVDHCLHLEIGWQPITTAQLGVLGTEALPQLNIQVIPIAWLQSLTRLKAN
jgi:hypothetical protein